jgi:hypothetical protein
MWNSRYAKQLEQCKPLDPTPTRFCRPKVDDGPQAAIHSNIAHVRDSSGWFRVGRWRQPCARRLQPNYGHGGIGSRNGRRLVRLRDLMMYTACGIWGQIRGSPRLWCQDVSRARISGFNVPNFSLTLRVWSRIDEDMAVY